jgi:hypothetical protein
MAKMLGAQCKSGKIAVTHVKVTFEGAIFVCVEKK